MEARYLDNPAGRLHYWLQRLSGSLQPGGSLRQAWLGTLELEHDNYKFRAEMGRIAGLVPHIVDALEETADPGHLDTLSHNINAWSTPVFLWGKHMDNALQADVIADIVQPGPLASLYTLAAYLSAVSSEGVVPPKSKRDELLDSLEQLEEEIRLSDIAQDLRDLLMMHVLAMKNAIRDVLVRGPMPIRVEAERFVGACIAHRDQVTGGDGQRNPLVQRALTVFGAAYLAFTASPTVVTAIGAWQDLAKMLPSG